MTTTLPDQLRDITNAGRALGHQEFRIAAMRFFGKMKMPERWSEMALLKVDDYLTKDELAARDKLP